MLKLMGKKIRNFTQKMFAYGVVEDKNKHRMQAADGEEASDEQHDNYVHGEISSFFAGKKASNP